MSDNPAPPKKVGSLRDRIAAFEKPQASSSASGPSPPPPRPKPGNLVGQWKPKQQQHDRLAPATEDSDTDKAGMSAGDARQSISRVGGLKERMAALQGKGAFGAHVDPNATNKAPPLPSEQGKARVWRTVVDLPPPVAKHDEYNDDDAMAHPASDDATKEENVDGDSETKTEEELERERRAAIAARMAKLGGARVGMGPPIFGKKPAIPPKPKFSASDEERAADNASAAASATAPPIPVPKRTGTLERASGIPLPTAGDDADDSVDPASTPEESNKLSAPSLTIPIPEEGRQRTISSGQRSPSSMPAPAIPRRAAPPRRKQAPPPPPPSEPEPEPAIVESLDSTGDTHASEDTEMENDVTPVAATVALPFEKDEAVPTEEEAATPEAPTPSSASTSPSLSPSAEDEDVSLQNVTAIKVEPPTPHVSTFANTETTTTDKQEEAEAEGELDQGEPEDDHEESPEERRKRIAEKLKEMGAVNPFAGKLGEPAQITATAEENDTKLDGDGDKYEGGEPTHEKEKPQTVTTDRPNQYAHEHHDEDGSEVDYPGGSVGSPTSPTRFAPVPPVPISVPPPPPFRPPVEVEEQYEVKDAYNASGEFAEEEGQVSSAADVDEGESKKDIHVLLASRQWAEDGGDQGEDSDIYPLRVAIFTPDDSAIATPASPASLPPPVPSGLRPSLSEAIRSVKKPRPVSMTRYNRPLPPPPAPPPIEAPPAPPPQHLTEEAVEDEDEDDEPGQPQSLTAALNAALARRPPVPRMSFDAESAAPMTPTSPAQAINRPPPSPPAPVRSGSVPKPEPRAVDDSDDVESNDSDEEPSPLPPPPPPPVPARTRSPPPVPAGIMSPIMVNTPPPRTPQRIIVPDTPIEEQEEQRARKGVKKPSLPPPMWGEFTPATPKEVREKRNAEFMDDEDTDPIDPKFVLQNKSSPPSPQEEENQPAREQAEEDPETVRKKTIAERMAKLGGIRFGAPIPPAKVAPPKPVVEETEDLDLDVAAPSAQTEDAAPPAAEDPEYEDDIARRRRLAAKVAAMGGRGLGMAMFGIAPPPVPVHAPNEEEEKPKHELASPLPVPTARPPPRPPVTAVNRPPPPPPGPQELESEIVIVEGHEETEDEGEEIRAEDITEDEEPEIIEAPPPPPPPRSGRPPIPKSSLPPPPPPPPTSLRRDSPDNRRSSVQPPVRTPSIPAPISNTMRLKGQSPPRTPSAPVGAPPPPPPPPPPLVANIVAPAVVYNQHSRPTRTIPAPIPPLESPATPESSKKQQHPWELPNIPSGSFDLGSRPEESMQMSWTEVGGPSSSTQNELHTYPPGSSSNYAPFAGQSPSTLVPEALTALAQRLNPRIIDSAHSVHEKSKKNVIGDGSSLGFLQQVLSTVPTASTESLGHLIYAQTGTNVTRRAGDIVPGDIIALYDAKMKGHKGLASYSVLVGSADEPLLGIVSEFSASGRKVKVKAFAVNQHPNAYPTIDTPSYRLDDLKSGTVKVFRIAEF